MNESLQPLEPGPLVAQPHGGALRQGNPHRKGGRTPDRIRRRARRMYDDRMHYLGEIIDGTIEVAREVADGEKVKVVKTKEPTTARERVQALKELREVGFGPMVSLSDIRERLRQQIEVIRGMLPKEQADPLCKALSAVWKG